MIFILMENYGASWRCSCGCCQIHPSAPTHQLQWDRLIAPTILWLQLDLANYLKESSNSYRMDIHKYLIQNKISHCIFKLELTWGLSTGICWKVTGPVVRYVIWGVASWTVLGVAAIRTFWIFGETAERGNSHLHPCWVFIKLLVLFLT